MVQLPTALTRIVVFTFLLSVMCLGDLAWRNKRRLNSERLETHPDAHGAGLDALGELLTFLICILVVKILLLIHYPKWTIIIVLTVALIVKVYEEELIYMMNL